MDCALLFQLRVNPKLAGNMSTLSDLATQLPIIILLGDFATGDLRDNRIAFGEPGNDLGALGVPRR